MVNSTRESDVERESIMALAGETRYVVDLEREVRRLDCSKARPEYAGKQTYALNLLASTSPTQSTLYRAWRGLVKEAERGIDGCFGLANVTNQGMVALFIGDGREFRVGETGYVAAREVGREKLLVYANGTRSGGDSYFSNIDFHNLTLFENSWGQNGWDFRLEDFQRAQRKIPIGGEWVGWQRLNLASPANHWISQFATYVDKLNQIAGCPEVFGGESIEEIRSQENRVVEYAARTNQKNWVKAKNVAEGVREVTGTFNPEILDYLSRLGWSIAQQAHMNSQPGLLPIMERPLGESIRVSYGGHNLLRFNGVVAGKARDLWEQNCARGNVRRDSGGFLCFESKTPLPKIKFEEPDFCKGDTWYTKGAWLDKLKKMFEPLSK